MKKVLFMLMVSILLVGGCGKKHLLPPSRPRLKISHGEIASDTIVDVLSGDSYEFVSSPSVEHRAYCNRIYFYWGNGRSTRVDEHHWITGYGGYGYETHHVWFLAGTTTINFDVTARAYYSDGKYAPTELSEPLIVRVHKDTLKR